MEICISTEFQFFQSGRKTITKDNNTKDNNTMADVNIVTFTGTLSNPPQTGVTKQGTPFARFTFDILGSGFKNGESFDIPFKVMPMVFGKRVEFFLRNLNVGNLYLVNCELATERDGENIARLGLKLSDLKPCDLHPYNPNQQQNTAPAYGAQPQRTQREITVTDDDIPGDTPPF